MDEAEAAKENTSTKGGNAGDATSTDKGDPASGKHYGSAPADPSPTAPKEARRVDVKNELSSTARPSGDAVNGRTDTTDITDTGALGTGTRLKNK